MPIVLYSLILLPVLAAVLIGLKAPARPVALLTGTALILLASLLSYKFDPSLPGYQFMHDFWVLHDPQMGFNVGLDGMSLVLVLLSTLVLLSALWAVDPDKPHARLLYGGSLLIGAGALGAFLSTDLVFFYAFHELALIPTFLMIGICGRGTTARASAWKITIYLGAGSLVLLVGLIGLFLSGQDTTLSIPDLVQKISNDPIAANSQANIALLLLIGFGTLISLVPFHSWAMPAYADAPTPVSMLHAGVIKKFGLYGILRLALPLLPDGMRQWAPYLLVLLLANILYMGMVAIAQKRLDRMLGASSVMHMGYIFLAVATLALAGPGNRFASDGALLLMFAHGISIAMLFALIGRIEARTGTLEIAKLGGLGKAMPNLGFFFGLAGMAAIGLPGLANFPGELMVFLGAFQSSPTHDGLSPLQWTTIAALWGVVISAVYMLRAYRRAFMGPASEAVKNADLTPLTLDEKLPFIILSSTLVVVGIFPNLILQYLPF